MTVRQSPTYVSLFSSGGLGCFGLKMAGYKCLGTAELIQRRIEVQKANNVCEFDDSYYNIDLTDQPSFEAMLEGIHSKLEAGNKTLDILTATPPCQGMSVANHKKSDELPRNSLVIKSIEAVIDLSPNIFVFENVRSFLKTHCMDLDGSYKTIEQAILDNLSGKYNIESRIVNLKDYGSPSSRTRTLVIGTKVELTSVTPSDLFPEAKVPPNLKKLIGHLPRLKLMGEIHESDIYHGFRKYDRRMLPWISATPMGKSAFENATPELRPHQIVEGLIVPNKSKNGDKYQRQRWDQVAPCVHTRNDILASQNTVHPEDNRVFSIRELMLMMGVPDSFRWSSTPNLNSLSLRQKEEYLSRHEINIRQCLGEGVPTPIFASIGRAYLKIKSNAFETPEWEASSKEELANPRRAELSAFYTNPGAVHALLSNLPIIHKRKVRVLEPSCGNGAMLPQMIEWFSRHFTSVAITLVDIDADAIERAKVRLSKLKVPANVTIEIHLGDFLSQKLTQTFDYVIGNPPYGKTKREENLFISFLIKAREISTVQGLIIPKSFLQAAEYKEVRDDVALQLHSVTDLGESCFENVLIETICLVLSKQRPEFVRVTSWTTKTSILRPRNYLVDRSYPSWLIYRNSKFDDVSRNLEFDCFDTYRDRSIRKANRIPNGDIILYRSKNIDPTGLLIGPFETIDSDNVPNSLRSFIGKPGETYVIPNLSYYPRIARLPNGGFTDGSCALLKLKNGSQLTTRQKNFICSEEFFWFYRIAMNYSTRSLNVDKVSAFYLGLLKENSTQDSSPRVSGAKDILKWIP